MDEEMSNLMSEAELEEKENAEKAKSNPQPEKEPEKEQIQKPEKETETDPKKEPEKDSKKETEKELGKETEKVYGKSGYTPAGVQERINSLTKKNYDLRNELDSIKKELERLKKGNNSQSEPTKEDFLKAGKTEEDYISYRIQKGTEDAVNKAISERELKAKATQQIEDYHKKENEARLVFSDYDSVVYSDDLPSSEKVAEQIISLPNGPDVIYSILKQDSLKKQYISLDESNRIEFVNNLSKRLTELKQEALSNVSKKEQWSIPQQKVEIPEVQEKKINLREPSINNSGKPLQPPNLADCSMEEFERYYGNMR